MRTAGLGIAAALALAAAACGATTTGGSSTGITTAPATLSGATVTFMTREDGKDEDSAIAVQVIDDQGRLSAEGTVVDVGFGDKTVSPPLNLTTTRTMTGGDIEDARLRLRLTPDGRDTWIFDMRMVVSLSDGTQRQYFWSGLRLDEGAPERTVTFASGRMP